MSLYGTGRAEGFSAAVAIVAVVAVVHVLGTWQELPLATVDWPAVGAAALPPALAGLLFFRFLRAMGRSRYAAFLTGAMYALSPWFVGAAALPREQWAAALVPLALEAAHRCARPNQRWLWLPLLGPCLCAPLLPGATLVGAFALLLAFGQLLYARTCAERDDQPALLRRLLAAVAIAAVAGATLVWLDPFAATLHHDLTPTPAQVLAAHRPSELGVDFAALLRLPGPVMLLFAVLGLLRRQRHADPQIWLFVAALGALPAVVATCAATASGLAAIPTALQTTSVWLCLLACAVLSAAGLDDFLELPLRRSCALPWLLAFSATVAPLIPWLGSRAPDSEWPLTATFLGFALLLPLWRRIGILRFKNVLTAATLLALAVPALQVLPGDAPSVLGAAPGGAAGESGLSRDVAGWLARPVWHYVGLFLSLLSASLWLLSASLRKYLASRAPARPHRAIAKKAPPSHRA